MTVKQIKNRRNDNKMLVERVWNSPILLPSLFPSLLNVFLDNLWFK